MTKELFCSLLIVFLGFNELFNRKTYLAYHVIRQKILFKNIFVH